jgi:ketopantoate reductase
MLQDIENGRKTEADAILGKLVEIAREKGKELVRTQTVHALIKAIENASERVRE